MSEAMRPLAGKYPATKHISNVEGCDPSHRVPVVVREKSARMDGSFTGKESKSLFFQLKGNWARSTAIAGEILGAGCVSRNEKLIHHQFLELG